MTQLYSNLIRLALFEVVLYFFDHTNPVLSTIRAMFRNLLFFLATNFLIGCSEPYIDAPEAEVHGSIFTVLGIPAEATDRPTIAHINIVNLDQNGVNDVLVCDVSGHQVTWIQNQVEKIILSNIDGPVHAETVDIDGDGDLDVLIAAMGVILPSTAHTGKVIILENDGNELFTKHVIAENIQRVTDVQAGDLDGDGDLDLSVAQFGYTQGQVQWFENEGDWDFTPHQLINRSGAIHAPIVDIDNDGDLDIVALLSQEWETVVAFVNNGSGSFMPEILHDVADADFSSSGIQIADLDKDGDKDILWTNGDAFVSVDYRPLPSHGLQWLENHGNRDFEFHRIGKMEGAYGPTAIDFDNDGDVDIVTVSEFAFWDKPETPSVVWWEQGDNMSFTKHTIAKTPTHLVTCDVGDINNDGKPDIVVGGMALYPPFDRITRIAVWHNDGNAFQESHSVTLPKQIQFELQKLKSSGLRGMFLQANGFDSINAYNIAFQEDSENAKWPYYIGLLLVAEGNSNDALDYFKQAELIDSTYSPLLTRLGELYVGIGDVEIAKEYFVKADSNHARVALAQLSADDENWVEVIEILKGINTQAASSLVLTAKAMVEGTTQKSFAAIDMGYQMDDPWLEEVEEMCILAPHLVTQAQTDFISGKVDSAERLLRRAIAIDPNDKDARLALATILLRGNRLNSDSIAESIVHLEAGLKSDPSYVMMRTKYGWALYLSQRYSEAQAVWFSILEDEPNHSPAFANLAQLAYQQQQFANSYAYFKKAFDVPDDSPFAMSQDPTFRAETLYRYSLASTKMGRQGHSKKLIEEAIGLVPSNATYQFELGNLLISEQQFKTALNHLEIANALQPNNPRILAALGFSWFKLEDASQSVLFLENAVKLAPTFALGWFHLGNSQVALGDIQSATESFKVAVQLQPTFTVAIEALSKLKGK
ncbi:MAG: tetratricopeptide repeat protein [Phycisphaerae bacterium]|nr:tetratricopeptide repeat protein [Phycisphaerae bacterium]